MDKALQIVLMIGILALSISCTYYFAYLPHKKSHSFNNCLQISEDTFNQKNREITGHVSDLEKQLDIAQAEADEIFSEFIMINPAPKKEDYPISDVPKSTSTTPFVEWYRDRSQRQNGTSQFLAKNDEWKQQKDDVYKDVSRIRILIKLIQSDFEKIETERQTSEDNCYRRFK